MTTPTSTPPADVAAGPPAPPWGLGHVGLAIVATLLVSQLVGGLVLSAAGVDAGATDDVSLVVRTGLQVGLWAGMLGSVGVVLWRTGGAWRRDLGLRVRPLDVPLGVAVGVACQLVLVPLVSTPWSWLVGRDLDTLKEPACRLAERADDPVGVVLFVLTTTLAAPVIEEVFYRGFIQRAAVGVLGRTVGVVGVALLFGSSHFQLLQLGALTAFGLVLGIVTERTGRLGPCIGIHMGFNAATALTLVATSTSLESRCGDVLGLVRGFV